MKNQDYIKKENIIEQRHDTFEAQQMNRINMDIARKLDKLKSKKRKNSEDEESFDIKRPSSKDKKFSRFNKHWRKEDNVVYLKFLLLNADLFVSQVTRRCNKVFLKMSKAMKNKKSPNQCKSHHQKMLNYTISGTTEEIIRYLLTKFNDNNLRESIKRLYLQKIKTHPNLLISQELKQFLNKQLTQDKIQQEGHEIIPGQKKRRSEKLQQEKGETIKIQEEQEGYIMKLEHVRNFFSIQIKILDKDFQAW